MRTSQPKITNFQHELLVFHSVLKVLVNGSLQSLSMLDIVDWLLKDNFDVEMCVIGHLLAIALVTINFWPGRAGS